MFNFRLTFTFSEGICLVVLAITSQKLNWGFALLLPTIKGLIIEPNHCGAQHESQMPDWFLILIISTSYAKEGHQPMVVVSLMRG